MVKSTFFVLAFVILGTWAPVMSSASAQATPIPTSTPMTACTVQPRTVDELNEIASTAETPTPGTPTFEDPPPYVKPVGTPATGQAIEGVTATIEQFVACINGTDFLRYMALLSDDFVRTLIFNFDLSNSENVSLLTPSPAPAEERMVIEEITDLIELTDGRISALVTVALAEGAGESGAIQITLVYDHTRERWMIEEYRAVVPQDGATPWTLVQGEGYEGVIVPPASAAELANAYVGGQVQERWFPTEAEVAALEQNLPSYLQTLADASVEVSEDFVARLSEYKRQYSGFIQNGRRLILVNATCTDDLNWRTEPVIVDDGGDCFFRVTYDPTTGAFEQFEVNGEG
jgi:chorismate mutase